MKNIIIKKGHSKKCSFVGTESEYYLPSFKSSRLEMSRDPFFWGTRAGNEAKTGVDQQWLLMTCNNPHCRFEAIINTKELSNLVKSQSSPFK